MRLLTKDYLLQNKWLVLIGMVLGVVLSAMFLRWPVEFLALAFGLLLVGFPYVAKTQVERMLRLVLIGFYISLALAYGGRTFLPLAYIGFAGSSILGAVIICLRYHPPAAEPS